MRIINLQLILLVLLSGGMLHAQQPAATCRGPLCGMLPRFPLVPVQRAAPLPRTAHPAVVKVISTRGPEQKHGSGTLVARGGDGRRGLVVTCAHVLCSGYETAVIFPSGARSRATILAADALHDCALLAVDVPPGVQGMPLASTYARPGDTVTWAGYGGQAGYAAGTAVVEGYREDWLAAKGRVRNGDSGGPLFAAGGLVGVVCELSQASGGPWRVYGPQVLWIREFIRQRAPEFAEGGRPRSLAPPSTAGKDPRTAAADLDLEKEVSTLASQMRTIRQRLERAEKAQQLIGKAIPPVEAAAVKEAVKRAAPVAAARWAPWLLPVIAGASAGPVGWGLVVGALALRRWWRKRKAERGNRSTGASSLLEPRKPEQRRGTGTPLPRAERGEPTTPDDRPAGGAEKDFPAKLPVDNTEAEQFLRLSQLEGRDPVHDALVGRLAYDELEKLIEKDGPEAGFARNLKRTLEDRFNAFVPLAVRSE